VARPIDDEQVVYIWWIEDNMNPPNSQYSKQQKKQEARQRLGKQGTTQRE